MAVAGSGTTVAFSWMLSIAVSLLAPFDCPPVKVRRKTPVADWSARAMLKVPVLTIAFALVVMVIADPTLVKVPPAVGLYESCAVLKPLPLLSTAKLNERF